MLPRLVVLAMLCLSPTPPGADDPSAAAVVKLPVTEVTVFKDGHAFVLQQGKATPDPAGTVLVDQLPVPVLGTFWAYSADKSVRLVSVTGTPRLVHSERPALDVQELIEANVGAAVEINTGLKGKVVGKILDVPRATPDPLRIDAATQRPSYGSYYDNYGNYLGYGSYSNLGSGPTAPRTVLIETKEGVVALPLQSVTTARFPGGCKRALVRDEYRNQIALRLAGDAGSAPSGTAIGMLYLQKGIRWIPSYRIALDGKGHAAITLQATLLNELIDLDDTTVNLVVGVPTFFFKDTPDPISLRQAFPPLSRFFNPDSQTGFAFSNVIQGQGGFGGGMGGGGFGGTGGGAGGGAARYHTEPGDEECPVDCSYAEPDTPIDAVLTGAGDSQREEDLFVFTVRHVSLKRGESATVPVSAFTVDYSDVYTLNVGLKPPSSVSRNSGNSAQDAEARKLLDTPRATHVVRIRNTSHDPFTTAPALIQSGDRILAQGLLRYIPVCGEADLTVTTSGDIEVKREETEGAHTPKARLRTGFWLEKVDVTGRITLTNYGRQPMDVEVVRPIPGPADEVSAGGAARNLGPLDGARRETDDDQWTYWDWPYWWYSENGRTRITWKVRLLPGAPVDLTYKWHYFSM